MTKVRILVFLLTILVVGTIGTILAYYARGFRFSLETLRFSPNGILVVRSDPEAAQIFIDGELETATNATLSLPPGIYEVEVKKEGYFPWKKTLEVEKEVVTEANISLFRTAPSLSPVTFVPTQNPLATENTSKIAYTVPFDPEEPERAGLWIIETINLPIGFTREPRRILEGNLEGAVYEFSPDGRQIILSLDESAYLIDTTSTVTLSDLSIISPTALSELREEWEADRSLSLETQLRDIPDEIADIFKTKAVNVSFSPDQNRILYTASSSAELKEGIVPALPGSSTQPEKRNIEEGQTYVYDIKEDRNFLIENVDPKTVRWFPSSRHLIAPQNDKVEVIEYDGTNRQTIYSGLYDAPFAFPFGNTSRLLILTNLGSNGNPPNLFSLTVK